MKMNGKESKIGRRFQIRSVRQSTEEFKNSPRVFEIIQKTGMLYLCREINTKVLEAFSEWDLNHTVQWI